LIGRIQQSWLNEGCRFILQPFFIVATMFDKEEIIIKPSRIPGEKEIPTAGIFSLNPSDAAYLGLKAKEAGGDRRFLFNSSLQVVPAGNGLGEIFVAGPAVGAPMAVMTLEKLIALGCRKVLVWGWCGALLPNWRVGDLVLATAGFSEEGTSRHYPGKSEYSRKTAWRDGLQNHLLAAGWQCREGKLWSTDAPYRETRSKVEAYAAQGAMGVEMEYTALDAVADFRGIELAALMLVSDELWGAEWRPGFQGREFKRKSRMVLDELFSWLRQLNR